LKEKEVKKEKAISWPNLNLEAIRSRQTEYFEQHKTFLQTFDGIIDEYLTLFLEMSSIALNCIKEKVDEDFMYAYATIGSRWFSHMESMTHLLFSGYYGDTAALARMVHGDINLLYYFSHFPEDVTKWRKLADYGPPSKDEPTEIKKLRHHFLDSEIRKRLGEKQLPFDDKGTLSQAVHATDWGTQFYARRKYDKEHTYVINFGPSYDPIFAFKMLCLMVSFVRPPCDAFLNHCQQVKLDVPGLKEVKSKYLYLLKNWRRQVDKLSDVMKDIAEIEAKVDAGEDFNAIIGEKVRGFEEMGYLNPSNHEK
jgi:hypothetical protein